MGAATDRIRVWSSAASDDHLLAEAAQVDPAAVSSVTRLRRGRNPAVVAAALDLVRARRAAAMKFGDRAAGLLADPEGVEQASSLAVAGVKAERFAAAGGPALDLGCGIGGDLMALAGAGASATAIDADPLRAWMASRNSGCPAAAARIEDLAAGALRGKLVHLDPSRRAGGKRRHGLAAMLPGPAVVAGVLAAADGGCAKLSPGVVRGEAEALAPAGHPAALGFVSESRGARSTLVQALLWTGRLAGGATRSATLVQPGGVLHRSGAPSTSLPTAPPGRLLFVPDPALERAELLATLGLPELAPGLGILTADEAPPPEDAAWLTSFEVLTDLPSREKKVAAWLRDHDAGEVAVKTRGRACEPDALARRWSGPGSTRYAVFVLRLGTAARAIVCAARNSLSGAGTTKPPAMPPAASRRDPFT